MLNKIHHKGSSLIETMIALFVLAVGLLGFASLLTNSLTMNQRAFTLSQAIMLSENLTERMRANRDSAASYGIGLSQEPPSSVTDCKTTTCTAAQIADWDMKQWFDLLTAQLPAGDAEVDVVVVGDDITVDIELHYELRVGKVGKGDASSVTQMENLLSKVNTYYLSTEI
jgi:type IV pilus assembly protein PilV